MEKIGAKLKLRREELGFSLEDMSIKTKIQPLNLKALEEGNISFFEDDISYLRYFLRFYCKALDYDFEEIREELDQQIGSFTKTIQIKKADNKADISNKVTAKIKENTMKVEKRKIDYSLVTLIIVLIAVAGVVVTFAFRLLPAYLSTPQETPPVLITPLPSDQSESDEQTTQPTEEDPLTKELQITAVDSFNYEIRGWNEGELISIRVEFGNSATWTRVYYDGVATDNPATDTYVAGETLEILKTGTNDLTITLHFGYLKNNKIFINNQEYTLADGAKDLTSGQQIHFVLKGE